MQAIDGVYWNVRDADGFRREAREVNRMGYDGKLTLHPHQIRDSNAAFVPSEEEMELAHRIVSMWKGDDDGGGGMDGSGDGRMRSMVCNGRMIDLPGLRDAFHHNREHRGHWRVGVGDDSHGGRGGGNDYLVPPREPRQVPRGPPSRDEDHALPDA